MKFTLMRTADAEAVVVVHPSPPRLEVDFGGGLKASMTEAEAHSLALALVDGIAELRTVNPRKERHHD